MMNLRWDLIWISALRLPQGQAAAAKLGKGQISRCCTLEGTRGPVAVATSDLHQIYT